MLREQNHNMGGSSYFVEGRDDLAALPSRARKVVAPGCLRVFEDFPASVTSLVDRARYDPFRRWLQTLVSTRCVLEVHMQTRSTPTSYVAFLDDERAHPGFAVMSRYPRVQPPAEGSTLPPDCPDFLAEIYASVGCIMPRYGEAGYLLGPDEVQTVGEIIDEHVAMGSEFFGHRAQYRGVDLDRAYSVWCGDGGDFLCRSANGEAFWIGCEDAPDASILGSIEDVLGVAFEALIANKFFEPPANVCG